MSDKYDELDALDQVNMQLKAENAKLRSLLDEALESCPLVVEGVIREKLGKE